MEQSSEIPEKVKQWIGNLANDMYYYSSDMPDHVAYEAAAANAAFGEGAEAMYHRMAEEVEALKKERDVYRKALAKIKGEYFFPSIETTDEAMYDIANAALEQYSSPVKPKDNGL